MLELEIGFFLLAFILLIVSIHHQGLAIKNIDENKIESARDHMATVTHTLPRKEALNPVGLIHYGKLTRYFTCALVSAGLGIIVHIFT